MKKNPCFNFTQTPTAITWRLNLQIQEEENDNYQKNDLNNFSQDHKQNPHLNQDGNYYDNQKINQQGLSFLNNDKKNNQEQKNNTYNNNNNNNSNSKNKNTDQSNNFQVGDDTFKKFNFQIFQTDKTGKTILSNLIQFINLRSQPPSSNAKVLQKRYTTIRKISVKLMKFLAINIEDLCQKISLEKLQIQDFFFKKLQDNQQKDLIIEKLKQWISAELAQMESIDVQKFINSYKFSMFLKQKKKELSFKMKNPNKINTEIIKEDVYLNQPSIVIQKKPPGSFNKKQQIQKNFDVGSLQKMELNVKIKHNLKINETIYWDSYYGEKIDGIYLFAYHFLRDYLIDRNLLTQVSEYEIQNGISKIVKQIKSQQNKAQDILQYKETLVQFDIGKLMTNNFEEIIKMRVVLKDHNKNVFYNDQFEWDIYSDNVDVEKFSEILVADMDFDPEYAKEIQGQIRKQIIYYLNKQLIKIAEYYPQFSENYQTENFSRLREKDYLRKKIIKIMNEHLLQLPKGYDVLKNTEITQSEILQLVQAHFDIIPQHYLNKLLKYGNIQASYPSQAAIIDNNKYKIQMEGAQNYFQQNQNQSLQDNKYIPDYLKKNYTNDQLKDVLNRQFNAKHIVGFKKEYYF